MSVRSRNYKIIIQRDSNALTTRVMEVFDYIDRQVRTVRDFGAEGNFNGSTGANDTAAITAALNWWSAGDGRVLHFPEGWYYFDGAVDLDLALKRYNRITMDGAIGFGTSQPVAWTIRNGVHTHFDANIRNGGATGNFSQSVVTGGGTTAIRFTGMAGLTGEVFGEGYRGRMVHFTSSGADQALRCRGVDMDITNSPRGGDVGVSFQTGQAFYADSGANAQTGGFGAIRWRGEGNIYGPVFERLNDVDFYCEGGFFGTAGVVVRGCVVFHSEWMYIGEVQGTAAALTFEATAGGRLNSSVTIDNFTVLEAFDGIKASGFDRANAGLSIKNAEGINGKGGHLIDADSVDVTCEAYSTNSMMAIRAAGTAVVLADPQAGRGVGDVTLVGQGQVSPKVSKSAGAIGYRSGLGGAVVQATSKTTAVTLNGLSGRITTSNAALAANAIAFFTVNNTRITADSIILLNVESPSSKYVAELTAKVAGSFQIGLINRTAGSLSEAVSINFMVLQGTAT